MCIRELSHKLKVSVDLQVSLISKYTEVTEASEAFVSTMAYHIMHKQYDQDMDLSERAMKQRDINFRKSDMDAVNYNFDTMMYLENAREEHVVTYREAVIKVARDFLDGIAIVTQGRLPGALISDNQLREILSKVDAMYNVHISHYRDMKMVTFAVVQQTHSLIMTFPAFIKNYKQPPLSLYEVETVPVSIIDKMSKLTAILR